MAGRAIKKDSIKKATILMMVENGTYNTTFNPLIEIYSEMREQYELYSRQLKKNGYKCDEITAAGGTKKNAMVSTVESLRKDILLYSEKLQLVPKSSKSKEPKSSRKGGVNPVNAVNTLAQVLKNLE